MLLKLSLLMSSPRVITKRGSIQRLPLTNPWKALTLTSKILMKMMMTFFYPLKFLQMTNASRLLLKSTSPLMRSSVLKSTGETREEWLNAGQNEIDNLTVPRTEGQKEGALIAALSTKTPQEKERLRTQAKRDGSQYIELPAMVVWTQKPEKHKCRILACGNQTQDIYGYELPAVEWSS